MAVTGLPSADSLVPSIAAVRRKLATEEVGFRNAQFSAVSTDSKVSATANGMVEMLTVTIQPSAFPTTFPPATLTSLGASIKDACSKVLVSANNDTKGKASADAAGYTLTGIPNLNQAPPATPGFQTSDADLTALFHTVDPVITAQRFQGISGPVSAVVDGTLALVSVTLTPPMVTSKVALEENIVIAINLALAKAKHLFDDGVSQQVNSGLDASAVTFPVACLWAQGNLTIGDRVKIKKQDGTFAPVVNAGSTQTTVGLDAQVGDLWSRPSVELKDRSKVIGSLRTRSNLKLDPGASVTGQTTTNGVLLQIPKLSLTVTFPGTNQGNKTVPTNGQLTLAPGAYAYVTVNAHGTLFLSTGTYFFNSWDVAATAKISCTSSSGQIVVNVKTGFTFRGSIVEKAGGRPKIFVGVFGTSAIPIEGSFTGTLMALTAPITIATPTPPAAHSGAFYAKDITINADNTITHFPFSGPPTPVST